MNREQIVNFLNTKQCSKQLAMDIIIEHAKTLRPQKDVDKLQIFLLAYPDFLNIGLTNSMGFIQKKYNINRIDNVKTGEIICYY